MQQKKQKKKTNTKNRKEVNSSCVDSLSFESVRDELVARKLNVNKIAKMFSKSPNYENSAEDLTMGFKKMLKDILLNEEYRREIYPKNVTAYNYLIFSCMPTLCYEPSFPRTQKIRWSYILDKSFMGIGNPKQITNIFCFFCVCVCVLFGCVYVCTNIQKQVNR